MKSIVVVMMAALLVCGIAHAERTVWYVHPDSALNTIQAGLDSCANNDIVLVGPGTYYENIIWPNTQGINLMSESGPGVTIIDGGNTGTVITCTSVDNTTIQGFTIQNGKGVFLTGSGINVLQPVTGSMTVTGNIITNNVCDSFSMWQGAVMRASVVTNNTISSNTGDGLAWCGNINNNIVINNTAHGIYASYNITNNYIAYNQTGIGNIGPYDLQEKNTFGNARFDKCNRSVSYGNVITHNIGVGISGGDDAVLARNDTITYNGVGISAGCYIDSCVIAYNYGNGVHYYGGDIKFCNIFGNVGYGVFNALTHPDVLFAENNWWGHATGPYHPDSNPGGRGDSVSDYVDFTPWLTEPVGVKEKEAVQVERRKSNATIFSGPLLLPEGKECRVFDITGRVVAPDKIQPGIYFIEVEGEITQKVVKIR